MLNQLVLVGRLSDEPIIEEIDNKKQSIITLSVSRSFKNEQGEYEVDNIPVILWNAIAENTKEYCHKGDVVGAKGRLQIIDEKVYVVAEKVTFLSSSKKEEEK